MNGDAEIARDLIAAARAAGADQADALVIAGSSVHVGVACGALEEVERAEAHEAGLRVIVGRKQASVSSSDLAAGTLREMAKRAVAIARATPEDPWCGLADPDQTGGHTDCGTLELVDPEDPPDAPALEALARRAEDAALGIPAVSQVEQAHAGHDSSRITLAATNGFEGSYRRSTMSLGVSAIAGEGLGRERDYAGESRHHRSDLPGPEEIGARAGQWAAERLGPRKPPGGAVPVLYDERCARSLVGHVLAAVNGAAVARGATWMEAKMGERILPEGLDLVEDPLRVRGPASRPFDAEGIAGRSQPIVEDGRLVRWVLDCATARKLGLATTGNARRGLAGAPSPGTTNVVLTQGAETREDLIRAMGTGLIVTSMIGASINATTGAYSRGASGFWVEDGEIAYPVNEVTIAGSLPEMLQTIRPANDAGSHRAQIVPSLLVQGLTVGA